MNNIKTVFVGFLGILLFLPVIPAAGAQSSFVRGEELFMQNRPQDALPYLEAAVSEDPAHVQAFLYLGIIHLQLNRLDDAAAVYTRILPRAGAETARITFNLGNIYFLKGDYLRARQYFSQAIEANPSFSAAFLNRANTLTRNGDLAEAVRDYETYISLEPGSPQRGQVLRLISFIRDEFAAEEQRRIVAEETARAEAERRRRLLEEVTGSLQAAVEGTKALSAGTENAQDFDSEFELE